MTEKQNEIDLLDRTIAAMPDGYLRDILTCERCAIVEAIHNDYGFIDLDGARRLVREEEAKLAQLKREAQAKSDELKLLMRQVDRANEALQSIRHDARRLAAC